jgi:hypothetical protein
MDPTRSVFEFVLFFLFQPNFGVEKSEVELSLLPIDTASSQAPGVPSEPESPDHCAEHLSRITDLDCQGDDPREGQETRKR